MTASREDIWLDVTRIVSRTGRGPFTGIDRVELAYIEGLLACARPVFGFARTATGFVLLDHAGLAALRDRVVGHQPWGGPDLAGRLSTRLSPARRCAESDLRRLAIATCLRPGLGRLLSRHIAPGGVTYLNVGHSNLTERGLAAYRRQGAQIAVMVHDTIPLDYPKLHRPGMAQSFSNRISAVARHAHVVLCPSQSTASDLLRHYEEIAAPRVAPLGADLVPAELDAADTKLIENRPYFIAIGTIDGRKNQEFLIDLWESIGPRLPQLYLVGSRGWCGPELADRLENLPAGVIILSGLSDGAVAALTEKSVGLLHPSLAEGYGFPVLDAALRGTPVVAAELPVYRETVGDIPVYLPLDDMYQWKSTITALAEASCRGEQREARRPDRPTWDAHLNLVLRQL